MSQKVSSNVEEYLQTIYRLQEESGSAKTMDLVKMLNVVPGTVTNTIERLEKNSLVVHEPYKGVKLTEKGHQIALRTLRKHRLSERLLMDVLDLEWDKVHDYACKLEHGISQYVAKKIEKALGHPRTCPHGNPIPTECGGIIEESSQPLTKLNPLDKGVILKITDERPDLLQYFSRLGLKPETYLEVVEKAPFNGPITIRIHGKNCALSQKMGAVIKVRKIRE